jgi:potassium channel subfamily K, other eukaryote
MKNRSWWFASTAIPLLAATIGPLANILSIAALVTSWRDELGNNGELPEGADELGVGIPDPEWLVVAYSVLHRTRPN